MNEIISFLIVGTVVSGFLFGVATCSRYDRAQDIQRAEKCFEHTKDKACWGIK